MRKPSLSKAFLNEYVHMSFLCVIMLVTVCQDVTKSCTCYADGRV